jgi:NAD(P)-dependent dehydrogenase (short-subunit alcohol dehydrogenase family)
MSTNKNGTILSLEERATDKKNPVLFRAKTFAETHPLPDFWESVCIVTGGTTGIGAATCAAFVQARAKAVYNLDVIEPESNENARLHFRFCDVSKPEQLRQTIASIFNEEGHIDHLVSNAGVWVGGEAMEDITEAVFDRVVGINMKGCFFSISSVVGFMKQQEPKGGSIVVVGSDQSFIGKPFQNLYGMTKGAIAQLAKSTAVQFAPDGIRVNCVCPGTIDTPLMHKAVEHMADLAGDHDVEGRVKWLETAQPFPRLGTPEEVAHTILFVLKMPFMVGAQIQIDGGYTAQ